MKSIQVIKFKMYVKKFNKEVNTSHIKYDWDAGHSYSYIDHPLHKEASEYLEDIGGELFEMWEDYTNDWLYNNDECPPCQIYVSKDGTSVSGCCSEEHTVEETEDIISEFKRDYPSNFKYLVQYE